MKYIFKMSKLSKRRIAHTRSQCAILNEKIHHIVVWFVASNFQCQFISAYELRWICTRVCSIRMRSRSRSHRPSHWIFGRFFSSSWRHIFHRFVVTSRGVAIQRHHSSFGAGKLRARFMFDWCGENRKRSKSNGNCHSSGFLQVYRRQTHTHTHEAAHNESTKCSRNSIRLSFDSISSARTLRQNCCAPFVCAATMGDCFEG